MQRSSSLCSALAVAVVCACVGDIEGPGGEEQLDVTPLDQHFQEAAAAHDVPAELLAAIGYVETGWQMVDGHEHGDAASAHGIMALRGDRLTRAAELAGLSEEDVRHDAAANIEAAAALLRRLADEDGVDMSDDLGAWAHTVGRWSGIGEEEARARYVIQDVYGTLQRGAELVAEDGTLVATLDAIDVVPDYEGPDVTAYAGDYDGAIYRPSPNNSARPGGASGDPAMVIIHTCEGGYSGCWGWLKNSASGVSAHYVVKENGAEITQLVSESRKAWHIGATYQCSRNDSVDCWRNGSGSNNFTIGIEHAGYASQGSFPSGQIEASAKLVCDITRRHGIPIDANHIVAHGQLQPYNRTDPGPNWPWAHYLDRIRAHCGDGGGSGDGGGGDGGGGSGDGGGGGSSADTIVIDSNDSRNDSTVARMERSASWRASNNVPGYYGTGYWWAATEPVSDGASFWFYLEADADRTVEAWWTAGSDRSTGAPFVAFDASGNRLGVSYQNQQTNGKRWVTLGTWGFTRGWNRIVLSRWAARGSVVIADAVRVR